MIGREKGTGQVNGLPRVSQGAMVVRTTRCIYEICLCWFNDAVPNTQSSAGPLCWIRFTHNGFISMSQKNPEREPVRDQ